MRCPICLAQLTNAEVTRAHLGGEHTKDYCATLEAWYPKRGVALGHIQATMWHRDPKPRFVIHVSTSDEVLAEFCLFHISTCARVPIWPVLGISDPTEGATTLAYLRAFIRKLDPAIGCDDTPGLLKARVEADGWRPFNRVIHVKRAA